ncbi:MAG: methionyl-tRNA formyltransferase [Treponema sp.]
MAKLKVFFAGTPACAVPALRAIAQQHSIVGILTNPPAAVGRKKQPAASDIANAAEELKQQGIIDSSVPLFTPEKLHTAFRAAAAETAADIMVCFAYGKIFGPKSLALFPLGALNIHPSLLPHWRGPSPVPAALAAGDCETGVTVQYMAQEMDAGDIILQQKLSIEPHDTAETLLARCSQLGAELIVQALHQISTGTARPIAQPQEGVSYCRLLQKDDGRIIWTEPAYVIDRIIRAYYPWPGAFTTWNGTQLTICKAAPYLQPCTQTGIPGTVLGIDKQQGILIQTGEGILAVHILQRQTKKAMQWKDFLNGAPNFIGTHLGDEV